MESRYHSGFSSLDRSFLDSMYYMIFGKEITNKGCSNCYRDAYIEIYTKLKCEQKMPKKSSYQLKAGAVITFFGSSQAFTNANLTDEVAVKYLSLCEENAKMFSYLPDGWETQVFDFQQNCTNDNVSDGLVGYQHSHNEQQEETETCASCKNPILHEDRVGCYGQRCYQAEMWHEMVEEHEGSHGTCSFQTLA